VCLQGCALLDAVVNEALNVYGANAHPNAFRVALQDVRIGETVIPRGSNILVAFHTLSETNRYGVAFKSPKGVVPEVLLSNYTFGGTDQHHCPGQRYVVRLTKMIMIRLVKHYSWRAFPVDSNKILQAVVSPHESGHLGYPFPLEDGGFKLLTFSKWP